MIKPLDTSISLSVRNNTPFNQSVNLLGGTSDPLGVPPKLLYQWDLSTEVYFGSVTASIVVSTTSNPTPVTYTVQVNGFNIESVVFALNTLNLGFFQSSGDIIYVSNDFYIYGVLQVGSNLFISTWNTNNTSGGSSASNQIQLPLVNGGTYNFVVDWGDGTQDTITSWNQAETLHTYATAGTYTLNISGTISEWSFGNSVVAYNNKILSISSWGSLKFGTISNNAFTNCINLNLSSVSDVPDLSSSNSLAGCFAGSGVTTINRINEWDISNITNTSGMFSATSFNQNISSWDVSSVTNMVNMFGNSFLFNQNINSWDVSSVTSMASMFRGATAFNQPLNSWNVANVTNMFQMFLGATSFNQNLNSWNVGNVTNMQNMFLLATSFNQNLNSWNVSSVTTMASMFSNTFSFNGNITSWDVSNVLSMASMFQNAPAFNQNIGSWNVSSVTNMNGMFNGAIAFNQNLNSWNTSNVIDMGSMFAGANSFNQSLNSWNTSSVNNMFAMFNSSISFNGNITSWNTSSVTNMSSMFQGAVAFNQNIGGWNVSSVTNMLGMFSGASTFNGNIGSWNTVNVISMQTMFQNANAFNQNIGSWNISNVTNFSNFMSGKTDLNYSSANLDAIYNGWSLLTVQPNLTNVSFGTIKYTLAGQAGKNILTGAPNNWSITDGGI
jgi:surface protein